MWRARAIATSHCFTYLTEGTPSLRSDLPFLRQHAALIKRAFQDVSPDQRQRQMESAQKESEDAPKNWPNKKAIVRIESLTNLGALCSQAILDWRQIAESRIDGAHFNMDELFEC